MNRLYPFNRDALSDLYFRHFNYAAIKDKVFLDPDNNFDVSQWIASIDPIYHNVIKYLCLRIENGLKLIPFRHDTVQMFVAMMQNEWNTRYIFIEEYLDAEYRLHRREELEKLPDWKRQLRVLPHE